MSSESSLILLGTALALLVLISCFHPPTITTRRQRREGDDGFPGLSSDAASPCPAPH